MAQCLETNASFLYRKLNYTRIFLHTTPQRNLLFQFPLCVGSMVPVIASSILKNQGQGLIVGFIVIFGLHLTYWSVQGKMALESIGSKYGPKTRARVWEKCRTPGSKAGWLNVQAIAQQEGEGLKP